MSYSLFPNDLLIAFIVFAGAIFYSGKLTGIKVNLNTAIILGIMLLFVAPLITYISYDYSTVIALAILAILSTKYMINKSSYISSATLMLVSILVGGYLLGWLY